MRSPSGSASVPGRSVSGASGHPHGAGANRRPTTPRRPLSRPWPAAIDAKHDPSGKRLQRRRAWATALAEAINLPPADIDALRTAALLLDIGQLAVPDHILSKPGPLSVEEFHKIRIHPQVSADLIAGPPAAQGRRRVRALAPRALGWQGIPRRPGQGGHPGRRPRAGRGGQLRCAGERSALPGPPDARGRHRRPPRGGGQVAGPDARRALHHAPAVHRGHRRTRPPPTARSSRSCRLVARTSRCSRSPRRSRPASASKARPSCWRRSCAGSSRTRARSLYLYDAAERTFKAGVHRGHRSRHARRRPGGGRCRDVRAVAARAACRGQRRPAELHGRACRGGDAAALLDRLPALRRAERPGRRAGDLSRHARVLHAGRMPPARDGGAAGRARC